MSKSDNKKEPNQKNSHLDDEVVIALEEAAKNVVKEKLIERNAEVEKAVLAGEHTVSTGGKYTVQVYFDGIVSYVDQVVHTKVGPGYIGTIYNDGSIGVKFNKKPVSAYLSVND